LELQSIGIDKETHKPTNKQSNAIENVHLASLFYAGG